MASTHSENHTTVPASKPHQLIAATSATMGVFCMGAVLGWSSSAINLLKEHADIKGAEGWIAAIPNLAGAIVMVFMAYFLDRFGRKLVMLVLAPVMVIGWLILAFVHTIPMLILGRFITGMTGASYSVSCPIYNSEISQKEIRGLLGIFYQLFLCAGVLFTYIIGYMKNLLLLTLVSASLSVVFFISFLFMPESPYFLMKINRKEDARKSLQWLRGKNYDIEDELLQIENFVLEGNDNKMAKKDIIKLKSTIQGLIMCGLLHVFQQASGIKVTVFYATDIFKEAGSRLDPYICTIIVGFVLTVGTAMSIFIVDRYGRRILLKSSSAVSALCLFVTGLYFQLKDIDVNYVDPITWLPLVALCIFLVAYTMGLGAVPWVILGEVFPNEIKGMTGSFCACVNWFLAFVVTVSFPYMERHIGPAITFWILSGFCVVAFIFITFFVIETKQKTLQEIQKELRGNNKTHE